MRRKRSKSIEINYVPRMEYQGNNAYEYDCVDCGWNDLSYKFNSQPCSLCIHGGGTFANFFDADAEEII